MNRWIIFLLPVLAATLPAADTPAAQPAKGPNIVVLLTDDQRADTIAALGNPGIITPHMDAIARGGLVFRNAYCMGSNSGAVCLPSRNMLLSGRTYFRFDRFAEPDKPSVPDSFGKAGYETWHMGKRGNTADKLHQLFEHSTYLDDETARSSGKPAGETIDAALKFLDSHDRTRPFLMWLEFAVPHDPRIAAPELMAMYRRDEIRLPANYLPEHPFDNGELTVRDETLAPWPRTEDEIRRHLHDYYAVISGMDREIGRFVAALRAHGEWENTVVVLTSDHGLAIGSHGLMGKQNLYEDGMKPPLVISGPGIAPGETHALVYLHDLFPTLCELADIPVPDGLDGVSLAPVIRRERTGVRDSLFLSYKDVQRAVRDARFKIIHYPTIGRTQLFDLETDPWETRDLAGDKSQSGRIASMMSLMREWQHRVGDPLKLDKP